MKINKVFLSATLFLLMVLTPWKSVYGAEQAVSREEALQWLNGEAYLLDGFRSHLTVAVLNEDGGMRFVEPGEELVARDLVSSIDPPARYTELWGEPASDELPGREKKDYSLHISQESHAGLEADLWAAPVLGEWSLSGNLYDKSLLRNYLALTLAGELGNTVYLSQFCEVFVQRADGYQYQGVYLLTAPSITEYRHIQRGNHRDEGRTALNTYAFRTGHLSDRLFVPGIYDVASEEIETMEQVIDQAESSIYSYDFNEFSKYGKHLDMEKLYDYFILYELLGNASSAHLSHYLYDGDAEKFWPVILPDFEYAVDNAQDQPMDLYDLEMIHAPYYSALVKSVDFVNGLSKRYRYLAQGVLNSSALSDRIDDAVALLGEGQLRDWYRWEEFYNGPDMYRLAPGKGNPAGDGLPPLNRNTYTYEQEIIKLKFSLREHGSAMFAGIYALYRQKNMAGSDAPYVRNTWMFLLFLVTVVVSIRIVRYRTR